MLSLVSEQSLQQKKKPLKIPLKSKIPASTQPEPFSTDKNENDPVQMQAFPKLDESKYNSLN
jgi:hypothetical protein